MIPGGASSPDSHEEVSGGNDGATNAPSDGRLPTDSDSQPENLESESPAPDWSKIAQGPPWPVLEDGDRRFLRLLYSCGPDGCTIAEISHVAGKVIDVAAQHALVRLAAIGFAEKVSEGTNSRYIVTDAGHKWLLSQGIIT
jgi:hypothetical protein